MKANFPNSSSILVAGATGLIGNTIYRYLSENSNLSVFGSVRNSSVKSLFSPFNAKKLQSELEAFDYEKWNRIFRKIKPDVVINCVGITKHHYSGSDPLIAIPINSYFPHYLNSLCLEYGARLIHISTDCVFSGNEGDYLETDTPNSKDLYGHTKALGEINKAPSITLRTSTIGHELQSTLGLLDWFLAQKGACNGYKNAFFSGVTTIELAKIIERYIIPNHQLQGLYHVGSNKISKFDLLSIIAKEYSKKIEIIPDVQFKIDRSLNSCRFTDETGYKPPTWNQLIKEMRLTK